MAARLLNSLGLLREGREPGSSGQSPALRSKDRSYDYEWGIPSIQPIRLAFGMNERDRGIYTQYRYKEILCSRLAVEWNGLDEFRVPVFISCPSNKYLT